MAEKPPVHVLPRERGWAVVREGRERAASVHPTQAEAAEVGRQMARKDGAEFLLHAKDGRVRDRSDYGGDSGPSKGKTGDPAAGSTRAAVGSPRGGRPPGERMGETQEAGDLAHEERYAGYEVHDRLGEKLGGVDALFLDEDDDLEYVGVETGLPGAGFALIPAEVITVDDPRGRMVVARPAGVVEGGPTLAEGEEATPEFEGRVRRHYGLDPEPFTEGRGAYGDYHGGGADRGAGEHAGHTGAISTGPETAGTVGAGMSMGDTETGEFREHDAGDEGVRQSGGSDLEDADELRVQRSEEELRAGTREREAGAMRVRKRVRTDRERIEVPTKHEEVTVERVPVSGEATEAQIGEDEVEVPVTEEEIVVDKRAVAKEEVRVRKDVVEDTEVVEEDVRREEIDVEDETTRRNT